MRGNRWWMAAIAAGCAGCAISDPAMDPIAAAPAPGGWLVWNADGEGASTVWIDATGAEVARERSVHLFAGVHLWRFAEHEVPTTGIDCACQEREDPSYATVPESCRTTLPTEVLVADDLLSGQHVDLVTAPTSANALLEGDASPGVSVELLGSVGPYLFFETAGYAYGCGAAHGNEWKTFEVVDASGVRPMSVEPLTPSEVAAVTTTPTAVILSHDLVASGDVFDAGIALTELRPRWREDGQLVTEAQLTWETCYACSDGLWDAYTRSSRVPTPVPGRLRAHATAPAPVIAWWQAHPPGTTSGWSAVPTDQLEAALTAFRE
jgi:hypothetical protein